MSEELKDQEPVLKPCASDEGFFQVLYPCLFLSGFILVVIAIVVTKLWS